MTHLHRICGALLLAFVMAMTPAWGAVDNTVCSASDSGGTTCNATQLKANANEEVGALSKRAPFVVTVSGTNTITGCPSPAITAYVDGMIAQIKPAANNTGAVTINWCSIGAVDAVSASGAALGADDLQSTTLYQFRYYSTNNQWRALGTLGTGTATASAPYVTATESASLSSERVLTAGTAMGVTDGGANTTITVALTDAELTCVAALTSAADKVAYYTGSGTCAVTDLSTYARTLIDDADAATARTTLGLVIGTHVQGYDADLAALGGLTSAADKGIQFTGAGTAATYDLTTAGKALLDDADAAAQRTTMGVAIGSNVQAFDADLSTWAGLTPSANAQSLVTAADYAAMRTLLSLVPGTNVQAFDADLSTWAGVTPSANGQSLVAAANYAAMRALLDLEAGTDFYSISAADTAFIAPTEIDTSAELRAILTDEEGTGAAMFGITAAMSDDLTCTGGFFLRRNAGDTAWECAAITGGGDALTSNPLSQFAATTSAQFAGVISNETGTGLVVLDTSPTLVTPNLGTPSAITLTNGTGLPISTGVSGLGTSVATALATPSSANLRSAATDEIGTGPMMFGLAATMSDDLSCTASQIVRRNSGDTAFECATVAGAGDMVAANNLSDVASAATSFSNIKQAATDTATGVVELATSAEAVTGSDTTRAVTPAGVAAAIAATASSIDVQTFTASGTWTKPGTGTKAFIQVWGGGGSGGRGQATAANAGGGGGGYNEMWVALSSLGATETVTIGAGGAAVTTANTAGNVGGNTTFGAHLTGYGGGGGGHTNNGGAYGGGGGGATAAGTTATSSLPGQSGDVLGYAPASTAGFNVPGLGGLGGATPQNASPGFTQGTGGGGAPSNSGTGAPGAAGAAINGGGGGGAGAETSSPAPSAGGDSKTGGDGGAGAYDTNAATAGSQPGGGGGGAEEGNSGAGGAGKVIVTVF